MRQIKFTIFILYILVTVRLYSQPYGWYTQTSSTSNNLNGVCFPNSSSGIIVGQSGTIIRTTNGGTNWSVVTSGTGVHLFGAFFIDASTGWAVGDVGVILKTINGGLNWSSQNSGVGFQLRSVSFRNSTTGYVVGWYGSFLRTTNGGTTWVGFSTGITSNLSSVSFADANNGFAVGQFGKIIRTTNGGTNWIEIPSGTTMQLEQVSFTSTNEAIVVGEGGVVRKTTNLGNNWSSQTSGTGNWLNGLTVRNQTFSVFVGDYGTIRKTSNGGANWFQQASGTGNLLSAVSFTDTNTGWAVGINGTVIKTTTGGWVLPGAATLSAPNNGQTCFSLTGTLDWSDVAPPISNYRVQIATDAAFAFLVHNVAGLNISQYVIPVSILNHNTLYYWRVKATNQVGESASWSSVRNFRTVLQLQGTPVLQLPANNSITGITPVLVWDSVTLASSYRCRIATDTGFTALVLDSGNISGVTITVPAGRLQPNVRYYWKVNSSNICNTGIYSASRSFTTAMTSVMQTGSEIPGSFGLFANYPNPFNPYTTIKFDIPTQSKVKISVFNTLGEELSVVLNSELNAGKYFEVWNGNDLGSGVYFYRLEAYDIQTGNILFVQSNKMILIK
ncbi:MAG: T9SS type A sorting domain-containing protein [Ignavibacteria bacterium]|nr:T9SS type A sorting domain-containing protein [Ignavibacteria bacterium]